MDTSPPLPDDLVALPSHPGFAIRPNGDVWRTTPNVKGRYAGEGPRLLTPVIHPRGHQWAVFLRTAEGVRQRVPIRTLLRATFGVDEPVI